MAACGRKRSSINRVGPSACALVHGRRSCVRVSPSAPSNSARKSEILSTSFRKDICVTRILAVFACFFVGFFSLGANAAPATTTYDVEVLIFENKLPALEGGELWTRDNPRPQKNDFADAITIGESFPAESGFSSTAAALERDGAYKVLLHR